MSVFSPPLLQKWPKTLFLAVRKADVMENAFGTSGAILFTQKSPHLLCYYLRIFALAEFLPEITEELFVLYFVLLEMSDLEFETWPNV